MNRRQFLGAAAALPAVMRAQSRKPNVVLLFADDLGWGELGAQGATTDIPTPNIDSIAKGGVRFTNGYVSCPVCSPTRAGMMTGRYQQRFGHEFNPGPAAEAADNFGLPLDQVTIADRMKKLGYATGLVGKWHLGYRPEYHPMKRGFDEYFGFLGGAHDYFNPLGDQTNPVRRGTEPVDEKEYLTDAFAREATGFIERNKTRPFFLYLAFNAVHAPLQAPEKYLSRFSQISDSRRRTFAAMLSAMDDAVGRVLAKLREARLENDTLVFFISDNGGPTLQTSSKNAHLNGYKGQALEGGIRVPFFVQWKGHIPAGKVDDRPVIALDVLPTAVAAGGGEAGGIDGVNLLPFVMGKNAGRPHEKLFWRFGPQAAVRKQDWKLTRADGEWRLYDLAKDPGEKQDLAATQAAKAKELRAEWDAWNAQLMEPKWLPGPRGGKKGKKKKKA